MSVAAALPGRGPQQAVRRTGNKGYTTLVLWTTSLREVGRDAALSCVNRLLISSEGFSLLTGL